MTFPTSPINGQTAVVNNITYQYNSASRSWKRVIGAFSSATTIIITGTSNATSVNSGALQVSGGIGVGKNVYAGGTVYSQGWTASTGTINTSTLINKTVNTINLAGGTRGSIPVQSTADTTEFLPIGLNGFVLQSDGTTAKWVSTSSLGISVQAPSLVRYANTATNLAGGAAFQIPYQTAAGRTGYIAAPTAGTKGFLYWDNSLQTYTWLDTSPQGPTGLTGPPGPPGPPGPTGPTGTTDITADFLSSNGYVTLKDGTIFQWGIDTTLTQNHAVTFPISFPNAIFSIMYSGKWNGTIFGNLAATNFLSTLPTAGPFASFTVGFYSATTGSPTVPTSGKGWWYAVGA